VHEGIECELGMFRSCRVAKCMRGLNVNWECLEQPDLSQGAAGLPSA